MPAFRFALARRPSPTPRPTTPPSPRRSTRCADERRADARRRRAGAGAPGARGGASCATCATARTPTSRRRGTPSAPARAWAPRPSCRARSCPTPTCSTSTPRPASSLEFDEPAAAVIKHTNPCGVATGSRAADAYVARARGRPAVGVRRHRRAQPAARRRDGAGADVDLHRGGDCAGGRRRGACRSGREGEPARGDRGTAAFRRPARRPAREVRSMLGGVLVQAPRSRAPRRTAVAGTTAVEGA